jgi:hypothetical protein
MKGLYELHSRKSLRQLKFRRVQFCRPDANSNNNDNTFPYQRVTGILRTPRRDIKRLNGMARRMAVQLLNAFGDWAQFASHDDSLLVAIRFLWQFASYGNSLLMAIRF